MGTFGASSNWNAEELSFAKSPTTNVKALHRIQQTSTQQTQVAQSHPTMEVALFVPKRPWPTGLLMWGTTGL